MKQPCEHESELVGEADGRHCGLLSLRQAARCSTPPSSVPHGDRQGRARRPRRRVCRRLEPGPDGTDYQEWISWTDIAPPERIALLHGESRGDPNAFESILTFAPDGAATRSEMRTVFPTKELRDEAVETYHAIEGGQQTLSNLAAYVTDRSEGS
ncbi:MAG: SRPBCC domain-containing protein [Actinomycetota bacterium]|nr:SRPBCC domain-containing protein [Actinomycetota bacterium]